MGYRFAEKRPTPEEYVALREAAGMKPRSVAAARRGLPNTLHAVTVREVGDGGESDDDRNGDDGDPADGESGDDSETDDVRESGDDAETGEADAPLVGMGRVVGDDGCFYQLVDIAVHPDHQRRGLGTRIVAALMAYVEETAPDSAYVTLISDVDGFYERFGFEDAGPESKGMFLRVGDL